MSARNICGATLVTHRLGGDDEYYALTEGEFRAALAAVKCYRDQQNRKGRKLNRSESFEAARLYQRGMSIGEVALRMGCSVQAAKSAIGRVRQGRYDSVPDDDLI